MATFSTHLSCKASRFIVGMFILLFGNLACKALMPDREPTQIPLSATTKPDPAQPASPAPAPTFQSSEKGDGSRSIYNEDIPATHANRLVLGELELMLEAGQRLLETSWNGDQDTPLPITIDDFDANKIQAYIADELGDEQALIIPEALSDLYISPQATDELSARVLQARQEYLNYLVAKGARQELLTEIEQTVLPGDSTRLIYHPENDPLAPPTATEGLRLPSGEKDYAQLEMNIYPVDIYNAALSLEKAKILGEAPGDLDGQITYQRQLRDMATRYLIYHEMTHVVQCAYVNLHVSEDKKHNKNAWIYATQTLITVDTQYHWRWGNHIYADSNNRQVSDESQAEGIAFEILTDQYNMSHQQSAAVWDHFFGRLEGSRATLEQIRLLFEDNYPELSPDDFDDLLSVVIDEYPDFQGRNILQRLVGRLNALPAYVGYHNPMLPQDTPKFWDALRINP